MSVLFDDLQPRRVVGFTPTGNAIVNNDGKRVEYEVWLGASGNFVGKLPEPAPIDQVGEREKKSTRERWAEAGFVE